MKQRIYFNEVVTRDGFQMEPEFVPTDTKVELINELSQCGYSKIEVTSFTSAKAIPMLRDAEAVMQRIRRVAGVEYSVLVPNVRGAERALENQIAETVHLARYARDLGAHAARRAMEAAGVAPADIDLINFVERQRGG